VSKSLITHASAGPGASARQAPGSRADFIAHLIAVRVQAPQTPRRTRGCSRRLRRTRPMAYAVRARALAHS
jgi:hypothetical protein